MSYLARARRTSTCVIAMVVTGLLAACDSTESVLPGKDEELGGAASPTSEVSEPQADQGIRAQVAWSTRIDAIGQPVEAGKAVLVLARKAGGTLELVSLDRGTGRQNFAMPFHPGGTPSGVGLTPKVTRTDAGRHLAIVRRYDPGTPGPALVAVDVRRGTIVRSATRAIDDYGACSDGHDVCWSGYDGGSDAFGPVRGGGPTRWDLETGRVLENDAQEGALQVGTDLYVRGDGRTSVVTRLVGSQRTAWIQSTSLAVGTGRDPSYGWSFELDEEAGVYVGSLGMPPAPRLVRQFEQGKRVEVDYTRRYLSVGIDKRTGEQLWRRKGANPWCSLLRGAPEVAARTLCVVDGSSVQQEGRESRDKNLSVTLEGIDPRTGDVLWNHRLEGDAATRTYADGKAPLAPYGVVLPAQGGPVALDMRTGELQRVADDVVLLCTADGDRITVYGAERSSGTIYRTCTRDGRDAAGALSLFGVTAIPGKGATRVITMSGRVVAYRV